MILSVLLIDIIDHYTYVIILITQINQSIKQSIKSNQSSI